MPGYYDVRDEKGRFVSEGGGSAGTAAWSGRPGGGRQWTDQRPEGLPEQTWHDHFDAHPDLGGKPTAERAALHEREYIGKALDKPLVAPGDQKIAIMTMGGPGSGKGSLYRDVEAHHVVVDPDEARSTLPEDKAGRAVSFRETAKMSHEEASYMSKQVEQRAIQAGQHLVIDGTGKSGAKMVQHIQDLQKAGYHVEVRMAHLPRQDAEVRIAARAEKTGRHVPAEVVKEAYEKVPRNVAMVMKAANVFQMHDTSRQGAPVVWSKGPKGEVEHDPKFVAKFRSEYGSK